MTTQSNDASLLTDEVLKLARECFPDFTENAGRYSRFIFTPDQLSAFFRRAQEMAQAPQWVPVSERLPEPSVEVLLHFENGDMTVASLARDSAVSPFLWYSTRGSGRWRPNVPTHWALASCIAPPASTTDGGTESTGAAP